MIIAVDYDGTFDADRALWLSFIGNARARGHAVICVTNRTLARPLPPFDAIHFDAVIYAGDQPKRRAALDAGVAVEIFIDDMPETIGSALLVGETR